MSATGARRMTTPKKGRIDQLAGPVTMECLRLRAGSADGRHGQWQAGDMDGFPAVPAGEAPPPAASVGPEAARWVDVFPWIDDLCQGRIAGPCAAELARQLVQWRADRPAEDPVPVRLERVAVLGDIAIEFMADWPLGRLVPGLPGTASVDHMGMTTRIRNALFRATYETAADLALVTVEELMELRTVGRESVAVAVRALIGAAALAPPASVPSPAAGGMLPPTWEAEAISDLRVLSAWYAGQGMLDWQLLASPVPEHSPPGIQDAWQRLMSLTAVPAVPVAVIVSHADARAAEHEPDLKERAGQAIAALSPRQAQVAALSLFADGPPAAEQIAAVLGLSRARIRQLRMIARGNLVAHLDCDGLFTTVTGQVRDRTGIALPLSDLLGSFPLLAQQVPAAGQPLWRVLSRLGGGFEADGGWCACPTLREARAATRAMAAERADAHGVVPLSDLGPLGRFPEWLAGCGLVIHGDWVFTSTESIGDWAVALLSACGMPLTDREIHATQPGRSLRSVQKALYQDSRLCRSDLNTYALADWGMAAYGGINALIRDELARNGGQLALDDLVRQITGRCKATPRSIAARARQAPFQARGGIVSLAVGIDPSAAPPPT
jgi:hypothetical protein